MMRWGTDQNEQRSLTSESHSPRSPVVDTPIATTALTAVWTAIRFADSAKGVQLGKTSTMSIRSSNPTGSAFR
ncbi:hypothetical protein SAMN04488556_1946 [Halostagnicola kamekurae]|uniref:Uncharacterized protein n=1 Tax=Halostagnicola kamekurae TaxID=619731 RepID=A0A1I6RNP3_9EURY|nr:hypothetical protein SAMN04488556_1946 [Halostagnicola kamekurae]